MCTAEREFQRLKEREDIPAITNQLLALAKTTTQSFAFGDGSKLVMFTIHRDDGTSCLDFHVHPPSRDRAR
jgi:hypothetical protein